MPAMDFPTSPVEGDTLNEVSVGITQEIQADAVALINNKLKDPSINEARHLLSGALNEVVEPGHEIIT